MWRIAAVYLVLLLFSGNGAAQPSSTADVRLYVLDCGRATLDDGAAASDTGELDHQRLELADPCFLVQHGRQWLLWDAGLAAATPAAVPGLHAQLGPPLAAQLEALGITAESVDYLAFSHLHFDHVGNSALFARSTWLLNRAELAWAEREPAPVSIVAALFASYRGAKTLFIEGDHDVFGDGLVRILSAPGHTPGSAVLLVSLARSGPVLLSGDLYISRLGRRSRTVPRVNVSRADTLASMDRVERILRRSHARLIIQHDPRDYAALPKPPAFLQ